MTEDYYWKMFDGEKFYYPDNYSDFTAYDVDGIKFGSTFENCIAEYLVAGLEQYEGFIDIGACCGAFSVLAASRTETVIAFEPCSKVYPFLLLNVKRFENVRTLNVAAWSEICELTLKIGNDAGGNVIHDDYENHLSTETVKAITLDSLNIEADIIKIDVEGTAMKVLEGGEQTIRKAQMVFVENHSLVQGKWPSGEADVYPTLMEWGFGVDLVCEEKVFEHHIWKKTRGFIAEKR